jgi:hypothetical protein
MYTTLADAAIVTGNPVYGAGTTKVYYWKGSFAADAMMGHDWLVKRNLLPTRSTLTQNYVLIGTINLDHPEDVFHAMQGEMWSPQGQANMMIRRLDTHTSMSMGDIVEIMGGASGVLWLVDSVGFKKLPE